VPARVLRRPVPRPGMVGVEMPAEGVDPAVDRANREATTAIQRLEAQQRARSLVVADLTIGTNRVLHRLGRRPSHCLITPTTASAAFAYALTSETNSETAVIDVVGADQVGAGLVFE
jgi:hypothetical protein